MTKIDIISGFLGAGKTTFIKKLLKEAIAGEKVVLVGFGSFETKKRAARKGKNPQTGAIIDIPASTVPTFKVGKALKDAVK